MGMELEISIPLDVDKTVPSFIFSSIVQVL